MTDRRTILKSAATIFLAGLGRAQDAEPTFSTSVKVVNVLATVRNKQGEIIRDLVEGDFAIQEENRPQKIRYFAKQSDLPLTIGLMVDTSMSQQRLIDKERGASYRFLDQVIREDKDKVFIMQFDMSVQLRQPLTASRKQLDDTLALVDTPTRNELRMVGSAGGTLLYDAVLKASNDQMKQQHGRKALILMTDGVDFGSENTDSAAIDAAQKADTLIYSIYFTDPGAYGGGGPDGQKILSRMSKETGGGFFAVSKKVAIDQIFDQIQDELRSQYSLGYVSDVPVVISEFRKITVSTREKGLRVQARDRYWAQR